jgi:RHS repeat-associated protein
MMEMAGAPGYAPETRDLHTMEPTFMTGLTVYATNACFSQYLSTGKERDTESGNDYFDARYYSSAMGRFMSPDWSAKEEPVPYAQLDDPQSLNLYAYVQNNPLVRVDADGHCLVCVARAGEVAVGAGVGAGIGAGIEVASDLLSGQKVTWSGIKGAAAEGAITGAVTAGTEDLSLVSKSAYGAGAGVIGGIIGRDLKGKKNTTGKVLTDAVTGAAGPTLAKAGKSLGAWVHGSSASEIEGKIGSKMSARHINSLQRQAAAAGKAESAGSKAAEVVSGTATSTAKNVVPHHDDHQH